MKAINSVIIQEIFAAADPAPIIKKIFCMLTLLKLKELFFVSANLIRFFIIFTITEDVPLSAAGTAADTLRNW